MKLALLLPLALFHALPSTHAFPRLPSLSKPAARDRPTFPYTGARLDGRPGSQIGGVLVPAPGDIEHQYQDPPHGAQRGPCPGLNTAANHGFLSRDGITTYNELVAAQQNIWNIGPDLAVFLAVLGIVLDGDPVTARLSIGGDATARTSALGPLGALLGAQGGLATHNTFEADTSLTRNDFFPAHGDNYSFNGTLFAQMRAHTRGAYGVDGLARYRAARWDASQAHNPNFYFGPKALLLYGAASFLYEVFPSSTTGVADQETVMSFFGAVADPRAEGGYRHVGERIPAGWRNRVTPYALPDIAVQIVEMYLRAPRLFGGNVGPHDFDALGSFANGFIAGGNISSPNPRDIVCFLYQLVASDNVPDSLSNVLTLPVETLSWALGILNPVFGRHGCPLRTDF